MTPTGPPNNQSNGPPNPEVPFPRSYWVVPGMLLAGCYPGSINEDEARAKIAGLVRLGIRTVVNLMEEDEINFGGVPFKAYDRVIQELARRKNDVVDIRRFPIEDMNVPSIAAMKATLDYIDRGIEAGRPVFVHCWGGRGRTGTVVGCYLTRHGIAEGEAALQRIRELRANEPTSDKASPETPAQKDFVRSWRKGA